MTQETKRKPNRAPNLDRPFTTPQETALALVIQSMVYKYLGVKDHTSEGGWKFPNLSLKGYDETKPRFFLDERLEILLHGWKNYVHSKYGKPINSLGMSAVMQNQVRKSFKNNELLPYFNPNKETHQVIVERLVCGAIESLLEFADQVCIKDETYKALKCSKDKKVDTFRTSMYNKEYRERHSVV